MKKRDRGLKKHYKFRTKIFIIKFFSLIRIKKAKIKGNRSRDKYRKGKKQPNRSLFLCLNKAKKG